MLVRLHAGIEGRVEASRGIRIDTGTWAFLTGEYPPQTGGVADHTRLVAEALAQAGEAVHVWTRGKTPVLEETASRVTVHRLQRFDGAALSGLQADLQRLPKPVRLTVQYVPHAFGWNGMNVPFCRWLARQPHSLWVIFHEVKVASGWNQPLRHNLLAFVTGRMAAMVSRAAERVYITIPAWKHSLPSGVQCRILPVPSNCATEVDPEDAAAVRSKLAPFGGALIGHFGTYGKLVRPYLMSAIPALLRTDSHSRVVLLGSGSERFAAEIAQANPGAELRVYAAGTLGPYELACYLAACDVVLQPYPDGASGRRGTLMSSLALGRPIVTTVGHLTEPFWHDAGAVVLVPAGSPHHLAGTVQELLTDGGRRRQLSANATELYRRKFALQHTIDALRS